MNFLKRLWLVIIAPIFLLNIVISTILIIPYWLVTGGDIYRSRIHTWFRDYFLDTHESLKRLQTFKNK